MGNIKGTAADFSAKDEFQYLPVKKLVEANAHVTRNVHVIIDSE
jgi:hypothetical protein